MEDGTRRRSTPHPLTYPHPTHISIGGGGFKGLSYPRFAVHVQNNLSNSILVPD